MKKKKTIKVVTMLIVASFLIVAMNNCKKDATQKTYQNQTEQIMTTEDISFSNKMQQFDERMKNYTNNTNYKSGEQFTVDSAIWYLEAWFNAKYAFPDSVYANTVHSNTNISLAVTDGTVTMDELNNKIAILKSNINTEFSNVNYTNKALLIVNLIENENRSNTEIHFDVHIAIGSIGATTEMGDPFGDDDAWKFGDGMGKCYETGVAGDAAELIEDEINANRPLVVAPPGYSFVYGPTDDIEISGNEYINPDDPTPYDNDHDMLIFYRTSRFSLVPGILSEDDECLEPPTMNFHYFGQRHVIYFKVPNDLQKPSNWTFIECNLTGEHTDDNGYDAIHHHNLLTYAMRYLVKDDWIEQDEAFYMN